MPRLALVVFPLLCVESILLLHATSARFWITSTQADFIKGELVDLSLEANGHLLLAPTTDVVYEATAPFAWTLDGNADGLSVGTGSIGSVVSVDAQGTVSLDFEAQELDVHALLKGATGDTYAGTSPNGKVVSISPDQETQTIFDPEELYIWDIIEDPDGNLLIATGSPGRIYRVTPTGEASLLYDTGTAHVLSLGIDSEGRILAGTGSPGRVFRIGRDGSGFILLEAGFDEIKSLRVQPDGTIYAVAAIGKREDTTTNPTSSVSTGDTPVVTVSTQVSAVVAADNVTTANNTTSSSEHVGRMGAVYRIFTDGMWEIVWSSNDDTPFDTFFRSDGTILIGTGPSGKIFQISEATQEAVLLMRAPAQQVTAFSSGPDNRLYFVTSNPAKLLRLSDGLSREGTFFSNIHDTETIAAWGTITWRGTSDADSSILLSTRTGNTPNPDRTWSRWSGSYANSDGSDIASPNARYIQWKAHLRSNEDSPRLRSVAVAYLPRNLRPRITKLTVHPPGSVFQELFPSTDPPLAGLSNDPRLSQRDSNSATTTNEATALGRQIYRKGFQTFVWEANDENLDQLQFDVHYRAENESTWLPLRQSFTETIFTWNTTAVPDGTYVLRVSTDDVLSNTQALALRNSLASRPFSVDNSSPSIQFEPIGRANGGNILRFTVSDRQSPIRLVEYSSDGVNWQVMYPDDGILDSREERFSVSMSPERRKNIIVRVFDVMNNSVTTSE